MLCQSFYELSYFVYVSNKGSGKTEHLRSLAGLAQLNIQDCLERSLKMKFVLKRT